MPNYKKVYEQKANEAIEKAGQIYRIALALHPATTLVTILRKFRIPSNWARLIATTVFPSVKKLIRLQNGR